MATKTNPRTSPPPQPDQATGEVPQGTPATAPEITRIGNLTADPETKFGKEKATPFSTFSLAVDVAGPGNDWSNKTTVFYEVLAFKSLGENVANSLSKGDRVIVVGNPRIREWTGDDGQVHKVKEILANAVGPDLRWAAVVAGRNPKSAAQSPLYQDEEPF
jgi:single-strand DNA-binding protein